MNRKERKEVMKKAMKAESAEALEAVLVGAGLGKPAIEKVMSMEDGTTIEQAIRNALNEQANEAILSVMQIDSDASVVPGAEPWEAAQELGITPEQATKAPKAKHTQASFKRLTEEALIERYPHVIPGTLRFEEEGRHKGKQTVEAVLECGHTARVATSDLFQKRQCDACKHPVKAPKAPKEPKAPKAKATKTPVVEATHQRLDAETRALALNAK